MNGGDLGYAVLCGLGKQETGQAGGKGALSSPLFYPIPAPLPGSCYHLPGTVKRQALPHNSVLGPSTQCARCMFGEWMDGKKKTEGRTVNRQGFLEA